MFSFLGKEEPALQLYGKLPLAKDYLRIGCADGPGRRLREWMDRGFSSALEGSATPSVHGPTGFLWSDGSSTSLLGLLWPSSDAGGLRPFPCVLFVERKWRTLWSELEESLEPCERWLDALEIWRGNLAGFTDGAALLSGLRGKKVTPGPGAGGTSAARAVACDDWLAKLWPEQAQAGLEALLGEVLRRASEADVTPLHLPLAGELPIAAQIHAWWRVLVDVGLAARKGDLALFFPRASGPRSRLTFFSREPAADQVAWLTGETSLPTASDHVVQNQGCGLGPRPTLAESICGILAQVRARTPVP